MFNRKAVGRPRKYATVEEFDAKMNDYLDFCVDEGEPITWTGLALFMGFYGRQGLDEYLGYPEFCDSVKRGKSIVEAAYEKGLVTGGIPAAGAIFALKNFNWKDKQVVDSTSSDGSMTPKSSVVVTSDDVKAIIDKI